MPVHAKPVRALVSGLLVAAIGNGCVTEGKAPPPPPRRLPEQPPEIRADRIVRTVGIPEDTDRNGRSDLIPVAVYLFKEGYDAPLYLRGRFTFRLVDSDAAPQRELARWEFDETQTDAALRSFMVGPGYTFRLSLLDAGGDNLPSREPLLLVTFTPRDGSVIEPRSGSTVFLGGR